MRLETGVWPTELQRDEYYTRAGRGDLGAGSLEDPHAEFRRTDFIDLRDFNFDGTELLDDLSRCFKYWIALTDCDGFRLDTLKHVTQEIGRNFCGAIKEYAANLGKANFLLVGEVAGDDRDAKRYREALGRNLHATLDIGGIRRTLQQVAKGLIAPESYLSFERVWDDDLGSHRESGQRHVSILDDHDHVSGEKVRFSSDAASEVQVVAGVALQLFSLGIPCIYYGTEQSFAGPERSEREQYLPDYNRGSPPPDKYLREAMFGPEHPLATGTAGFVGMQAVARSAICRALARSGRRGIIASIRPRPPTDASPHSARYASDFLCCAAVGSTSVPCPTLALLSCCRRRASSSRGRASSMMRRLCVS